MPAKRTAVAKCPVLVWRVPSVDNVKQEAHSHQQVCGRPVFSTAGVCERHAREPVDPRAERRFLKRIGRG